MDCFVVPKAKNGNDSQLYKDAYNYFKKRSDSFVEARNLALRYWATARQDKYARLFNHLPVDHNGEFVFESLIEYEKEGDSIFDSYKLSQIQAKSLIKRLIPNIKESELNFLSSAALQHNFKDVHAAYKNGALYFDKENLAEIPLRHEAFHKVFNDILTTKEQNELVQNFREQNKGFENASKIEVEEALAEEFSTREQGKQGKSITKNIQNFFNKLASIFGFYRKNLSNIDKFFNQVEKGYIRKPVVFSSSLSFNYAKRRMVNIQKKFGDVETYRSSVKKVEEEINSIVSRGVYSERLDNFVPVTTDEAYSIAKQTFEKRYNLTKKFPAKNAQYKVIVENFEELYRDIYNVSEKHLQSINANLPDAETQKEEDQVRENIENSRDSDNDLSVHTIDSSNINQENRLSSNVKRFLANVRILRGNNLVSFNSRAAYKKALEILQGVQTWSDNFEQGIYDSVKNVKRVSYEDDGTSVYDVIAYMIVGLENASNATKSSDLFQMFEENPSSETNLQFKWLDPDHSFEIPKNGKFLDNNTFVYHEKGQDISEYQDLQSLIEDFGTNGDVYIVKRGNQSSEEFFTSILSGYRSENAEINTDQLIALYHKAEASNTLSELMTNMGSLKQTNFEFLEVSGSRTNQKISLKRSETNGINLAIKGEINQAFQSIETQRDLNRLKKRMRGLKKHVRKPKKSIVEFFKSFPELEKYEDIINRLPYGEGEKIYHQISNRIGFIAKDVINASDISAAQKIPENHSQDIAEIADLILKNNEEVRAGSVRAADGKSKYIYTPSSQANDLLHALMKGVGFKGNRQGSLQHLNFPDFLNLSFFKNNIFAKGLNNIRYIKEFDMTKIVSGLNTNTYKSYTEEDQRMFFMRQFVAGFLKKLPSGPYNQYLPTISNRPTTVAVGVDAYTPAQARKALKQVLKQLSGRESYNHIKNYDKNSTIDFEVLQEVLDEHKDLPNKVSELTDVQIDLAVPRVYKKMIDKSFELAEAMVKSKVPMDSALVRNDSAAKSIDKYIDREYFKDDSFSNIARTGVEKDGDGTAYTLTAEELHPFAASFFINNYINSFQLNQLVAGDQAFFKHGYDVIKRASGVHAPGLRGKITEENRFSNVAVFQDIPINKEGQSSLDSFLEEMGIEKERRKILLDYFEENYDLADAQGFMLPQRRNQLKKMFGRSYGIQNILKPAYYGVGKDGVPSMMKLSSVVLTDSLIYETNANGEFKKDSRGSRIVRFPELLELRNQMERGNANGRIDEMVFESGFKVGAPKEQARFENGGVVIPDRSTVEIDNVNYRLQFNPHHSLEDSSVALFTQLVYFLNTGQVNTKRAEKVYKSLEYLYKSRLDSYSKKLTKSNFNKFLRSVVNPEGNERFVEMLEAGVSQNLPQISNRAFTQFSASLEKAVTSIRFKNSAKLTLQAPLGIEKKIRDKDGNVSTERLKYKTDNNGNVMYAEAYVSKGVLPKEVEKKIMEAETVDDIPAYFLKGDLLGFRIPSSELHSAVPLRVVGITDSEGNPTVITPKELSPLHGSDFDVDSLFVVGRQLDKEGNPAGYEWKNDSWKLKEGDPTSEAHAMNIIIETYLDTVSASENRERMFTPISMEKLKMEVERIAQDYYPNLSKKEAMKKFKPVQDNSNPVHNYKAHNSSFSGAKGTGIFANFIKVAAHLSKSNNGGMPSLKLKEDEVSPFTIDGVEYREMVDNQEVWELLDGLLNSAIDNVKEQILPALNITDDTINTYSFLVSMGIPIETVNDIFQQQALKQEDAVDNLAAWAEKNEVEFDNTVLKSRSFKEALTKEFDINELAKKPLNELTQEEHDFMVLQSNIASLYQQGEKYASHLEDLSTLLGPIKELPSNKDKLRKLLSVKNKLIGVDSKGYKLSLPKFNTPNFFDKVPHLKQIINLIETLEFHTQKNFFTSSPNVIKHIENLSKSVRVKGFKSDELRSNIQDEFVRFLMDSIQEGEHAWDKDFEGWDAQTHGSLTGQKAFKKIVRDKIKALKGSEKLADNKFLNLLNVQTDGSNVKVNFNLSANADYSDVIELQEEFEKLSRVDITEEGEVIVNDGTNAEGEYQRFSQIQKDLVRFAILQDGTKYGFGNYSSVLSPDILAEVSKRLDNRLNYLKNNPSSLDAVFRAFKYQYAISKGNALVSFDNIQYKPGSIEGVSYTNIMPKSSVTEEDTGVLFDQNKIVPVRNQDGDISYLAMKVAEDNENIYLQSIGSPATDLTYQLDNNIIDNPDQYNDGIIYLDNITQISVPDVSQDSVELRDSLLGKLSVGDIVALTKRGDRAYQTVVTKKVEKISGKKAELKPFTLSNKSPFSRKLANEKLSKHTKQILEHLKNRTGVDYLIVPASEMKKLTGSNKTKGHYRNGKVYINEDAATTDTLFHEYLHPFVRGVKLQNKELFDKLSREVARDHPDILEDIKDRYKDTTEEEQLEEAVVEALGQLAGKRADSQEGSFWSSALKKIRKMVKTLVSNLLDKPLTVTDESLMELNLQDVADIFAFGSGSIKLDTIEGVFDQREESTDSNDEYIPYDVSEIKKEFEAWNPEELEDGQESDFYKKGDKKVERVSIKNRFIHTTDPKSYDRPFYEYKADKVFKNVPEGKKISTDESEGNPVDKEEFTDILKNLLDKGRIKGKIIHKTIQKNFASNPQEEVQLDNEINELYEKGNFKSNQQYSWVQNNLVPIMKHLGYNFDQGIPEHHRDRAETEVKIINEKLGLGGSIDYLVSHPDGTYSITDWKTGKHINTRFYTDLMRYGDQRIDITNNPMERSKLQVMMYAVLLKAQYPEMKFRNLNIAVLNSEFDIGKSMAKPIEVDSYLPMIKSFLQDKKALEDAGLPEDSYKILTEKAGHNLFNTSHYNENSQNASIEEEFKNANSTQERNSLFKKYMEEFTKLNAKVTATPGGFKNLNKEQYHRIMELQSFITDYMAYSGMDTNIANMKDTNWLSGNVLNESDIDNAYTQVWGKLYMEATYKKRKAMQKRENEFKALLDPIKKKYRKKYGYGLGSKKLGTEKINYRKMYAQFYKEEEKEGYSRPIQRLITEEDEEWNTLDKDEKKFLKFFNDMIEEHLGPNGAFNEVAVDDYIDGRGKMKSLTHTQLYNLKKEKKDRFEYYRGFLPKVMKTGDEALMDSGSGSMLKGLLKKDYLRYVFKKNFTFQFENSFEAWDHQVQSVPIQYLGNYRLNASRDYSVDLEHVFDSFNQMVEHKKHMDPVMAYGKATLGKFKDEIDDSGEEKFTNTAKMLDNLITTRIQRRIKYSKAGKKSIRVFGKAINLDKTLMSITGLTSKMLLSFKTLQPFGNVLTAKSIQIRSSLRDKFARMDMMGLDNDLTDFGNRDLLKGEKEVANMVKDWSLGNLRKNKVFLIAEEMGFLTNSSKLGRPYRNRDAANLKIMSDGVAQLGYTLGEDYISYTTMVAMLNRIKDKQTGKSIFDLYDVIEDENGAYQLKYTGPVRGKVIEGKAGYKRTVDLKELTSEEVSKMKRVHEMMNGSYREEESFSIQAYSYGKMLMAMKRYLPRLIRTSMGSKHIDYRYGNYKETGEYFVNEKTGEKIPYMEFKAEVMQGKLRTFINSLLSLITLNKHMNGQYKWSNLNDQQKRNVIEGYLAAAQWAASTLAGVMMFGDDDDRNTFKTGWKRYVIDNGTQHFNPFDLVDSFWRSPTPIAFSKSKNFVEGSGAIIFGASLYGLTGNEDAIYTQKGNVRGWKTLSKNLPIPAVTAYFDYAYRLNNIGDEEILPAYNKR